MAVKRPPVRSPVKRRGTYPDQKPVHPTDLSFFTLEIAPNQQKCIQLHGRSVYYPILKKVNDPVRGIIWTDAIGDLEVYFDETLFTIFLRNVTPNCLLTIKVKVV